MLLHQNISIRHFLQAIKFSFYWPSKKRYPIIINENFLHYLMALRSDDINSHNSFGVLICIIFYFAVCGITVSIFVEITTIGEFHCFGVLSRLKIWPLSANIDSSVYSLRDSYMFSSYALSCTCICVRELPLSSSSQR